MDIASHEGLAALLVELDATGADWIRVLYTHPAHLTDDVLEAVATLSSVVPYLDIPIQHVSSRLLAAMGRGTDGDHIRELLARVRERVPGIFVRSSVIVGFPGETVEDFAELERFVGAGFIDHLGVFEFSPEAGTRAAELPDLVPAAVATERAEVLLALSERLAQERGRALVGERLGVLIDESDGAEAVGRHAGQAWELDGVVRVEGADGVEVGDLSEVEVAGADGFDLTAVLGNGETA